MDNKRTRVPPKVSVCDTDAASPIGEVLDSDSGDTSYGASYSTMSNSSAITNTNDKDNSSLVREKRKGAAAAKKITIELKIETANEHIVSDVDINNKTNDETANVHIQMHESLTAAIQKFEDQVRCQQQQHSRTLK